MTTPKILLPAFLLIAVVFYSSPLVAQQLYEMPENTPHTRWVSFENKSGAKGAGGKENKGAKGHPFDGIEAGQTVTLMDFEGPAAIRRIWLTFSDRSPKMLRSLRIDMYWEGAEKPAVSAPLGDFFGIGLGQRVPFQSAYFSDAEGRSFNCIIPMPFNEHGRVTITNESETDLKALFYEIDLLAYDKPNPDALYFHTYWNRNAATTTGQPFTLLPKTTGTGRYLGTNMGIVTNPKYGQSWWGEGEIKAYIDGDSTYPTLVGTGTEDYVGTAYGQGTFDHLYQGSPVADKQAGAFAFYRYHGPDPVYFYDDIRITIQQMGGAPRDQVRQFVTENSADLIPVTIDGDRFYRLLTMPDAPSLMDDDFPRGWTNFYRSDDVSATTYFYLNRPSNSLPPLAPASTRAANLPSLGEPTKADL